MTPFILKILLQFCVTLNEPGRLISISGAFQIKGFTGRQNLLCHSDAFAQRFVLWEQPFRQLDLVVSGSSRKGGELLPRGGLTDQSVHESWSFEDFGGQKLVADHQCRIVHIQS